MSAARPGGGIPERPEDGEESVWAVCSRTGNGILPLAKRLHALLWFEGPKF